MPKLPVGQLNPRRRSLLAAAALGAAGIVPAHAAPAACPSLLAREFPRLQDEKAQNLCQYAGQVIVVVNTASFCGFTPQYKSLEALYARYKSRGLVVLGFPSNDFGAQEPGSDAQIKQFCSSRYGTQFDLFSKISVKGKEQHPLFAYLTGLKGFEGDIRWNFNKFLVDPSGTVVARYPSGVEPTSAELTAKLESILPKN